ncbi:Protein tyrosine kinase Protein kinase domain [Trypanosoma vivax]|nr:Protein tyrosine kinase Protein kinase domain [Trypanosoma vivax]
MYNTRTHTELEGRSPGICSPLFELSSSHGRTPSGRERNSPVVSHAGHFRSDSRNSPLVQQFRPPPPVVGFVSRPLANEQDTAEVRGLNNAIPSSTSPLAEARYAVTATVAATVQRPSSATAVPFRRIPSTRPNSAIAMLQPSRTFYHDECGYTVEERDPVTHEVVTLYRCGALLGAGGFAQVFEFVDQFTGAKYAGKVIEKRNLTRRRSEAAFRMEVDIHSRLKHSNILHFVKSFQDDYYHYIILEQCSRKSLMDLSKERGVFTCSEMQYIMRQIVSAVGHMHSKLIIHRDLKLGNVMIDFNGNMKVGDFGFASELVSPADKKTTMCGTPNYMAPEVINTEKGGCGYGLEADIWSLGALLYALAVGKPPFETRDIDTTYDKIRRVDYVFPEDLAVPEACKDLIRWMLQKDPQLRPVPAQILSHSFLCLPPPPRLTPKSLVPPRSSQSTSPSERHSPLWESPVTVQWLANQYGREGRNHRRRYSPSQNGGRDSAREIKPVQDCFIDENMRIKEAVLGVGMGRFENKLIPTKPPPPASMIQSCVFCAKYGHGFLLLQDGNQCPAVFLNDKTKLLYDRKSDTVFYYGRCWMQTTEGDSGNRSPLFSEELAMKVFRDQLVVYSNASTTLVRRSEDCDKANRSEVAAAKKLAITKFFLPFLERGTRDKRMVGLECVLKNWNPEWERNLFACRPGKGNDDPVYVKDAVIESIGDLLSDYQDIEMQVMAARMSDCSFHVSMRCHSGGTRLLNPFFGTTEITDASQPWGLDLLVYSGFRALIAFETGQTSFALSINDVRRDTKSVPKGRTFFAAGHTGTVKHLTLQTAMLQAITSVLRKVRCCAKIMESFC